MTKTGRVRTPTVLQMEAAECGAASLSIVLGYYGLYLPLELLRQECGVSRDGSKASNVVKTARRLGMDAVGMRQTPQELRENEMPLIIHWEFNHFVVLEGFKGDTVYLNDPAAGHRTVAAAEFDTSFTGIALRLRPGPLFKEGGTLPGLLPVLSKRLGGHKKTLIFTLLTGAGLIVPGLALPVLSQVFLDDVLTGTHAGWLFNLMLAMGVAALIQGALTWLRSWCLTRWQGALTIGESSRFFWHLLRLPLEFFQQRFSGEVASRVQLNESVAAVLTGQAATAVLDITVAAFFLILLFQYSITLTLVGLVFTLINLTILFLLFRWLTEQQMKIQLDASKAYGMAIAGIQTIETIKAGGNEGDFFTKWAGYQSKLLDTQQNVELTAEALMLAPAFLTGLNTAVMLAVGGFQVMDGMMTAGIFVAFQSMMSRFQEPVNNLLRLNQSLQSTQTQMQRLDDVMRYQVDAANYPDEQPPSLGVYKLSGRVELRQMSFGYSRLDAPLIEDFNLIIEPGQRIALVGGSGSGKSTVAKLLCGLFQPWTGEILFDGLPRRRIPREVIVNSVASVDQDIVLFSGTVAENISLFDPTLSGGELVLAAKDAQIHDDVLSLQGGYDAKVDESGRNFSGGQRQRLEIARALAGNPSLLILDEATSALDPLTEKAVMDNICRRGCSCLIVAHRLSTIRDCDEILVLYAGKVVQRGRHDEMIAADGPYRQLVLDSAGTDGELQ